MSSSFEQLTAAELGKEVAAGRIDPEEVIERFIQNIISSNPEVNAFT